MTHLYVGKKIVTAWPATNTVTAAAPAGEVQEGYGAASLLVRPDV